MTLLKLFPTFVSYSPLLKSRTLLRGLVKECYQFQAIDDAGKVWSQKNYPFGYTSYSSIQNLPFQSSEFAKLFKKIDREVGNYAKIQQWDLAEKELKLESAWINIMGVGAHHSFHLHPLSVVSGTLFLQTPLESASFKFEDPRLDRMMAAPPRKAKAAPELRNHFSITPQAGHLLLFESHLRHEVSTHLATQDRISISFNYHLASGSDQ